jgi:hypothetical protein
VCENFSFDPVAVALERSVPLAKMPRQIAPRAVCAGNPQDRLKELAVVIARPTRITGLAKSMRLHLHPLGIGQYASVHGKLLSEFESLLNWCVNPESQQTLNGSSISSILHLPCRLSNLHQETAQPTQYENTGLFAEGQSNCTFNHLTTSSKHLSMFMGVLLPFAWEGCSPCCTQMNLILHRGRG